MAEALANAETAPQERLVVVWRVTTRCNLSCGFCGYDRTLPLARSEVDELSALRIVSALAAHAERAGRRVHVSLLGGEPLLWRALPAVARQLLRNGLSLGITSNGTALASPAMQQLLLETCDELTLSVDGVGELHDRSRGWPGGFAQLERSVRQLVRAKAALGRGPLLRVNTVLMKHNAAQLAELGKLLADWGIEELTYNRLGEQDRPEFFAEHCVGVQALEELQRALPTLRRELLERGLHLRGSETYVNRLLQLERGEASAGTRCEPGQDFWFVDERGLVAPCHFTLQSLGEGLPRSPSELDELPRRFLLRQAQGRSPACRDCRSTQVAGKFRSN